MTTVNPLRFKNTWYNVDEAEKWDLPDPNEFSVTNVRFGLSPCEDSSGGIPMDPVIPFPKEVWEANLNDAPVNYCSTVGTTYSAVALWPMEEASGNFLDFVAVNDAIPSGTFTRQVQGVGLTEDQERSFGASLDGVSAYATIADSSDFGGLARPAKSVFLWLKHTPDCGTSILFKEGNDETGFALYHDADLLKLSVWVNETAGVDATVATAIAPLPIPHGVWVGVVAVMDLANNSLLVGWGERRDAVSFGTATITDVTLPAHTGTITFGAGTGATRTQHTVQDFGGGAGMYYCGDLDNISYYNYALDRARIHTIFWLGDAGIGAI